MFLWHFIYALSDASVGRTLSPGSSLKPVAAPAAHSVMKGSAGTVLHDQDIATAANNAAAEQYLTPNYTVQSPYSTINVSENQCYLISVMRIYININIIYYTKNMILFVLSMFDLRMLTKSFFSGFPRCSWFSICMWMYF